MAKPSVLSESTFIAYIVLKSWKSALKGQQLDESLTSYGFSMVEPAPPPPNWIKLSGLEASLAHIHVSLSSTLVCTENQFIVQFCHITSDVYTVVSQIKRKI